MNRLGICTAAFFAFSISTAQQANKPTPDDIGFANGQFSLDGPGFKLGFIKSSQTLYSFSLGFDFLPIDRQQGRNANGYFQFGDLNLRLRKTGQPDWQSFSTATKRAPVHIVATAKDLSVADLAATFPTEFPLQVMRTWKIINRKLTLSFAIKNPTKNSIELGGLGIPLIFNNIISDRNLKEAHERCAFSDPYIGNDAGYVQVTRLSGQGPALVVTPLGKSPLEAYRPLNEPTRPNQTFEGMFEWTINSKAYAETEWKSATPWNPATSTILKPGETKTVGLQFLISPSIRDIEKTLIANKRPVAVGIPGYILPSDQEGKLFLNYNKSIQNVDIEPKGAMDIRQAGSAKGGYKSLLVNAKGWGRARLTITYSDGVKQTIHYHLTKPAKQVVSDMGNFLATKQYFTDPNDPFKRAPSYISYDREVQQQVTQDSRVWIAGLGDEGGSGSFVAAAMKLSGQPTQTEVSKFEDFVDGVLWGNIQFKDGPNKFGVKKSVFFYEPALVPGFEYDKNRNWTSWTSWNKKASDDIGRGYNYPHTVAAYWSMYRVARFHSGMKTRHDWQWYLDQAYETVNFMTSKNPNGSPKVWYVDLGLMEGSVFIELLNDLKREGWTEKANLIEARMKERTDKWLQEEYPFGSEMAWDSTGQEEVYGWCNYFNRPDKAAVSLNSILGYMPTLPHWGYNGNARRYWDFLYGGKLSRIERQLHHYGSGLNAIPVLTEYRQHPEDFYLLRVGYGGAMGALSNIDQDGAASVAFHSFPSTLKWDAYSGDYGPNFLGHALNAATYIVNHHDFGWQAFGGNVKVSASKIVVKPLDSLRQRVFFAPAGLWLTLDAGNFDTVEYDTKTKSIRVLLTGDQYTPTAYFSMAQTALSEGQKYQIVGATSADEKHVERTLRGIAPTWIELKVR